MQGYNFVGGNDQDNSITKGMIDEVGKVIAERKEQLPDDMQMALRNLSDANVCNLVNLDRQIYPDQSSPFQMRPIFAKENPHRLCKSLCKMSNKGRNAFSQFLSIHYDFHAICNYSETYKSDHDVLVELRRLLDKEAASKDSIEKMSFDGLLENLDKSIRRSSGEERIE